MHSPLGDPDTWPTCSDCVPHRNGGVSICPMHAAGAELFAGMTQESVLSLREQVAALVADHDGLAEWRPRIVKLVPSTLAADPTPAPMGVRARVFPHGYRADPCGEDVVREQAQRSIDA